MHRDQGRSNHGKRVFWSQLRGGGEILLGFGELAFHGVHHAALDVEALRARQVGEPDVGYLQAQIIVVTIEGDLAQAEIAVLVLRIQMRRQPPRVIGLLGLTILQIRCGSHGGQLSGLIALIQKLVRGLNGRGVVARIHEGESLVVARGVAVLVSAARKTKLTRRLGVSFLPHEHLAGREVALAILLGNAR